MLPRCLLALNALLLSSSATSMLEDTVGLVQTKTVARQDPAPIGSTCTFDGCGPPWEAQVVTVLSKVTSTVSPCYECAESGFRMYMRNKVPGFFFQPWRRTITLSKDYTGTPMTYYMPWTPTEGVFHNQTAVFRNNGVHTYIFTDGGNPNYVFRVDFFHEHCFARNDREYGMFHIYTPLQPRPSGSSDRRNGEILNGQTQCYGTTATEDHCLTVPAGSQRYTRYPMAEPYLMDSSNTPKICRAWGDPHYTTYAGQKYDFMGTGTFTVSKVEGGDSAHTLQVFNCPVKSGSTWNRRISQGIAVAVSVAGRTVSVYKGEVKVDGGSALPKRLHYFQGLILDVGTDSVVIQAFGADSFVMIRVTTRWVSKSAFGYVYDVTVQVPWKDQDNAVGLCKEKGDYYVPNPLFDAVVKKELEDTCCPPEGCSPPDLDVPPPNWTDLCTECAIPAQTAVDACAGVRLDDRDACLMDFCASCGDPDSVPPPPEDYPRDPIPPGPPFAVEDPHCRNVRGEAFDLHATGQLTFLRLPLQGPEQLRLEALIEPVGPQACAPTVIKKVQFSGTWLNGMPPLVITPGQNGKAQMPQEWDNFRFRPQVPGNLTFHILEHGDRLNVVLVVHGAVFFVNPRVGLRTHVAYLDLKMRELRKLGSQIGGLLGLDSHEVEAKPPPGCEGDHNVKLHGARGQESQDTAEDEATGLLSTAWVM